MAKLFGIIFASDADDKLDNLTLVRTTASVPFGGRYRCIDFTLSNMVNSNVASIGIVTRFNYASLMDHIRMGRDWDLNRMNGGITVFPPFAQANSTNVFVDRVEGIYGVRNFLTEKAKEDYVILANSNIVASIDYQAILAKHIANNADITALTYTAKPNGLKKVLINADKNGKVTEVKITRDKLDTLCEIAINAYVMKKSLLLDLITDNYEKGNNDFDKYIIQANVGKLNIYMHHIQSHCAVIDDVESYYNESMALLDENTRNTLFSGKGGNIYTRVKGNAPTRYKEGAVIKNSLIGDGCVIDGTVENSILFRGVTVEKGAVIKNSIVMEDGRIEENVSLDYIITDKDVVVTKGVKLVGSQSCVSVIPKGKIV